MYIKHTRHIPCDRAKALDQRVNCLRCVSVYVAKYDYIKFAFLVFDFAGDCSIVCVCMAEYIADADRARAPHNQECYGLVFVRDYFRVIFYTCVCLARMFVYTHSHTMHTKTHHCSRLGIVYVQCDCRNSVYYNVIMMYLIAVFSIQM